MSEQQPHALRLASFMEAFRTSSHEVDGTPLHTAVAAKLRGQHSNCEALRGALLLLMQHFPTDSDMSEAGWSREQIDAACRAHEVASATLAAIAKEQP